MLLSVLINGFEGVEQGEVGLPGWNRGPKQRRLLSFFLCADLHVLRENIPLGGRESVLRFPLLANVIERSGRCAEHFMTSCFTVHPFDALLDNEEGGLSQGHFASPLFTENLLVALQQFEAVFAESNRDNLMPGFLLEDRHHG